MENNPLNSPYVPTGSTSVDSRPLNRSSIQPGVQNFREVFERYTTDEQESIRFSSNAQQKLERAGIQLNTEEKARLSNGFKALDFKGVKDGLVVVDDKRFVVSVNNKTVITMMSSRDREVFTSIEGWLLNKSTTSLFQLGQDPIVGMSLPRTDRSGGILRSK